MKWREPLERASAEAGHEEQDAVMSTSESEYFYLTLRDAKKSLNMRINLMAKVSKIGTVLKSRGSDYVLVLRLVDRYESPPGLSVNLFADNLDKLPQVRSTGDIISLHHVEMKVNNGEFFCTFNGKLSSFALFNGEAVMDLPPYQRSINYQAADNDRKFLMQLRTTSENLQPEPEQGLGESIATLFCNLKVEENLTIVCKVLHASETSAGDLVLFVWDATDSPLVTLQIDLDMEGQGQNLLHPEVPLLSREALYAFPPVGTIIKLTVSKDFQNISHIKGVGYWVKLGNLQSGLWKGALTPDSYVQILSDEDDEVQCHQRGKEKNRKPQFLLWTNGPLLLNLGFLFIVIHPKWIAYLYQSFHGHLIYNVPNEKMHYIFVRLYIYLYIHLFKKLLKISLIKNLLIILDHYRLELLLIFIKEMFNNIFLKKYYYLKIIFNK
ncbi:hypothetical protein IEQ34_001698 [Dendrobium chrysotoxum]|uniref:Telomeric single stranded DNA binding POT1/Cdc13 domain-containing protein n=1 Tax=Dendrobium chrysotoxum TaxID=161865 RepID=A0AAV7HPQ7_DENCH|nr:hypothetical protein IEQ34_001698 [Dendrobium chrysotoxum]